MHSNIFQSKLCNINRTVWVGSLKFLQCNKFLSQMNPLMKGKKERSSKLPLIKIRNFKCKFLLEKCKNKKFDFVNIILSNKINELINHFNCLETRKNNCTEITRKIKDHPSTLSLFLRQYRATKLIGSLGLNKSTCLKAPSRRGIKVLFKYSESDYLGYWFCSWVYY